MAISNRYECDGQFDLLSYMTENFTPVELCIGIGHQNATKRSELPALLKEPNDRQARKKLNQMKKSGCVIVNAGRGKGYFVPTAAPEDYRIALGYYRSEKSKIEDMQKALAPLGKWLKANGGCL